MTEPTRVESLEVLVDEYGDQLFKLAMVYVGNAATAEEVVQETWLAALEGLDRFQGRSTLKTWVFRILANRARTRGKRDKRTVCVDRGAEGRGLTALVDRADSGSWFTVDRSPDCDTPERILRRKEAARQMHRALECLPANQGRAVYLRDYLGVRFDDACAELGVSESNQRVLLHRGRARLRESLSELASGL
jgi:RNA polymerase sigma-70 factor, ECF subfamily